MASQNPNPSGLTIALIILCAVGFLTLYFKTSLEASLNAGALATVSQQVVRLEARLAKDEQKMGAASVKPTSAPAISASSTQGLNILQLTQLKQTLSSKFPKYSYRLLNATNQGEELNITSQPGTLFNGGDGGPPVTPTKDEFISGFQISITQYNSYNYVLNFGQATSTKYPGVTEWPDMCEAGCSGPLYTKEVGGIRYIIDVSSSGVSSARIDQIIAPILAEIK